MTCAGNKQQEIEDIIQDAIDNAMGELEAAMEDSIEEAIQDAIDNAMDDLEAAMEDSIEEAVEKAFENMISHCELVLPDGTHIIPRKKLRLTSPDKTKVLLCYGGLRIEDTSRFTGSVYPAGWGLAIQTRVDSWEPIYIYPTKDEAVAALEKAKKAMDDGLDSFDL